MSNLNNTIRLFVKEPQQISRGWFRCMYNYDRSFKKPTCSCCGEQLKDGDTVDGMYPHFSDANECRECKLKKDERVSQPLCPVGLVPIVYCSCRSCKRSRGSYRPRNRSEYAIR